MSAPCIFCEIVSGNAPATIVREWPYALAFVPIGPVATEHTLVIPKTHVADFTENPQISMIAMAAASELASDMAVPCNLITSKGVEATQSIFHLHLHIVPRMKDDGLALPWYSGKGNHEH